MTKHAWSAPDKSKAVFSLRGIEGKLAGTNKATSYEKLQSRCRALMKRCGLHFDAYRHTELRLTDPRLRRLIELLDSTEFSGRVRLDSCWIEEPDIPERSPNAWFKLLPGAAEFKSPARPPANTEFSWGDVGYVASKTFRQVVEKHRLTGLDWLPLENSRPTDPSEWFQVFAISSLGRGLDHPLNDSSKVDADRRQDPEPRSRRRGEPLAWLKNWRRDIKIEDAVIRDLIRLSSPHFRRLFRVDGPERIVREHVPQADFAYFSWAFRNDSKPGRIFRSVCCNAHTRQILIDSGVMKPARFEGISMVNAAEANAVILDDVIKSPMPLAVFTKQEAARERARRTKLIARSQKILMPKVFSTTREAVRELRTRHDEKSLPWTPAKNCSEFAAISKARMYKHAPKAWHSIAPFLPLHVNFISDDGEEIEFHMEVPKWNDWIPSGGHASDEDAPSKKDLVLLRDRTGDWIAIRKTDPMMPGDARLVQWDHETSLRANEWPSVAAFVTDMLRSGESRQESKKPAGPTPSRLPNRARKR